MKKIILALLTVISFSLAVVAEDTPPAASSPNEPSATGPKRERQQMKRELHQQIREKAAAMHEKIKEACTADIATAGCTGKEGPEMMRCMRAYKEAHPEFKASEACREAMGERREFRKERQEMKKDMREKMHNMRHGDAPPASGTTTTPNH